MLKMYVKTVKSIKILGKIIYLVKRLRNKLQTNDF
jgi:hypothetical protein